MDSKSLREKDSYKIQLYKIVLIHGQSQDSNQRNDRLEIVDDFKYNIIHTKSNTKVLVIKSYAPIHKNSAIILRDKLPPL